jgi:L-amino acid N-acyltransferase YncA
MNSLIRPATAADLPAISAIYNHSVRTSTCTFALDEETLAEREAWFAGRTAAHPVLVAETDGEVVGWAALSAWNKRCGYATTVEWSVYIRHDWHRRGVASALLAELIPLARAAGHHTILGGVSGDQTASLEFHRRHGFTQVAHFRETGYKFGRWLDVIYFQLMLG